MEEEKEQFKIMSVREMMRRYYRPGEKPPRIELDVRRVPEALWPMVPLAEKWGISDDVLRFQAVRSAPRGEIESLRSAVAQYDDLLDQWLAGPEANSKNPSKEYLAFSNMRMAADGS